MGQDSKLTPETYESNTVNQPAKSETATKYQRSPLLKETKNYPYVNILAII